MPSTETRQIIARARRIVVKVGTNAICDARGRLDHQVVSDLACQIAELTHRGVAVTLVASGAAGAGMAELDLAGRPKSLPMLQATCAVGQGQLMRVFHDAFAAHAVKVAQVLVTRDDFEHRMRYLNIRNTLTTLARLRAVPIINENDAVAVDELVDEHGQVAKHRFGDNDTIAALVTNMLGADLLVLLSVVDGVMDGGEVLDLIEQVGAEAMSLVRSERSGLGSGGMGTKMSAAALVASAGSAAVIANGRLPNVLGRLLKGEKLGTVFVPARRRLSSRRRWIGQAARPAGKIVIDEGAARAIQQQGKSLLPTGIRGVLGKFPRGATVAVIDAAGGEIARGVVNYSSEQIDRIRGLKTAQVAKILGGKSYDEVIHRNNMTLT